MKIQLIKPARVLLAAGTVVDAEPAQAGVLISVGSAVKVEEPAEEAPKAAPKTKKAARK